MRRLFLVLTLLAIPVSGCEPKAALAQKHRGFEIQSPAFDDRVPREYTCDGKDASPPVKWSGAPAETKSFAVVLTDPDAPTGVFYHWAVWSIDADAQGLPPNLPKKRVTDGIRQAKNEFGKIGYSGPCPPPGHGAHDYHLRVFALKKPLAFRGTPDVETVLREANENALARMEIVAKYSRASSPREAK